MVNFFFKIPAYQKGGVIIPQRLRKRRASMLALHDPITLVVALDRNVCFSFHLAIIQTLDFL
jgi:hypothetical protein